MDRKYIYGGRLGLRTGWSHDHLQDNLVIHRNSIRQCNWRAWVGKPNTLPGRLFPPGTGNDYITAHYSTTCTWAISTSRCEHFSPTVKRRNTVFHDEKSPSKKVSIVFTNGQHASLVNPELGFSKEFKANTWLNKNYYSIIIFDCLPSSELRSSLLWTAP